METSFVESRSIIAAHKRLQHFKKETDLISVRKLIHKTIEACYSAYYDIPAIQYAKEFYNSENICERSKNSYTLVYFINGKLVGTGSLYNHRINDLFIDPSIQRRGIGKRIMFSLLCEAEKRDIKVLELYSPPGSTSFFQKLGFTIVSEEIIWVEHVFPLVNYLMEKKIP